MVRHGLEPLNDVLRRLRMLASECAPGKNTLNGLGHVQPGRPKRGVQGHDTVGNQPEYQGGCLMAGQIVQGQQHPQRW